MSTVAERFLGNLQRSIEGSGKPGSQIKPDRVYKVTHVTEPFVGKHIGDCLILERHGCGSMSLVYKAKQDVTERIMALKMLRAQLCMDPNNIKRFEREARSLSRLSHPNLPSVYQVGRTNSGQPYLTLEFLQGKSLEEILDQKGLIPWREALNIFAQVCAAMQYAHEQGIIHRDLKPANIMLLGDKVKVVDFGLVKIKDDAQRVSQRLTRTGEVWGSPLYMSPEQCSGKELDARSDIYSLGTVMYECLLGRPVFIGKNVTELIIKQLSNVPEPFAQVRPDLEIPDWLEDVVFRALQKAPAKRFKSMGDLSRALMPQAFEPLPMVSNPGSLPAPGQEMFTENGDLQYNEEDDELIGQTIGECYFIKSFIGAGGTGSVYRAIQKGTDRLVAVKVLRKDLCDKEQYLKRFEREAKSLGRVSHPNLISIFDVGTMPSGQPYMVMEYLEGKSLKEWVEDHGAMPIQRALPIFVQVCDVIEFAHRQGVIHRDIKPHNIMLVSQGGRADVVKVVDFGIVKLDENIVSVSMKLTASGEICGSPMYMSPEQILDEPLDGRTDVYSFGTVMYEVICGRPLFGGKKITEVMNKHINVSPPSLTAVCPDMFIPAALDSTVRKCLEKRPEKRYQTMEELKIRLLAVQTEMAGGPPAGTSSSALKPYSRSENSSSGTEYSAMKRSMLDKSERVKTAAIIVVVALIALGVGAGGALWFISSAETNKQPAQIDTQSAPAKAAANKPLHVKTQKHHR